MSLPRDLTLLVSADYPRRILVAAIGQSPQAITAKLYVLAVASDAPFVPTEIRLITTPEDAPAPGSPCSPPGPPGFIGCAMTRGCQRAPSTQAASTPSAMRAPARCNARGVAALQGGPDCFYAG